MIAEQSALGFTYPDVGATANGAAIPEGHVVDHTRIELGQGSDVFARAKVALENWKQFDLGWLEAFPTDTLLRKGQTVVVVARAADCGGF